MDLRHLIYFADPMCSWCWGFAPVIETIGRTFGERLPIQLVMGGLRPGTQEPWTEAARREIRTHWDHVREASGQPFDYAILERSDFVYDTDPAARAVVLMRRDSPDAALSLLGRIQRAFYAENRDVTSPAVLAELAAEFGADAATFAAGLDDEAVKQETWRDYAVSHRAGVTGFPTLVAGPNADGAYGVVTRGFQPAEAVVPPLQAWLDQAAA